MAEPARHAPDHDEPESFSDKPWDVVQRWVPTPSGRMEFQELELTPEYFLDPRHGDKVVQHPLHGQVCILLYGFLNDRYETRQDVAVLFDVKILWGDGERKRPSPDVMVIQGVRDRRIKTPSFNVAREGARPCLIIEVVSNSDPRIRDTDLVDKVQLYEKKRIPEYLTIELPHPSTDGRFRWIGRRLGGNRRYAPIEPDAEGRILSETTGLRFATTPDGQWIAAFDAVTGERLLEPAEIRAKVERERKRAQREARRAQREAEARKLAEAEVVRLREELARLKSGRD
jgi:Uma2 family endonuclease